MSAVYLKNYDASRKNLYRTISITGKRCIDQFDYVNFINCLEEEKHEKVEIISMQQVDNYGSVLQAYSLKKDD